MELSPIQIKILTKFITAESLKYSEAVPIGVDNDLYKYHLKHLVTKGYIKKDVDKYHLTEKGKLFGHKLSPSGEMQDPFYIAVMCILVVKDEHEEKILLQKRFKHPSYGETTTVCGKIHKGERIIDAAKRKLKEEAGLDAEFECVGMIRAIRTNKDSKLVNDQWFMVCYAYEYTGTLMEDNKFWQNYFFSVDDFFKLEDTTNPVRNLKTILKHIKSGNDDHFIIEDIATLLSL